MKCRRPGSLDQNQAVLLLALANCSESNDRSEGCLRDPLTTFADGKSGLGMTCLDYATALDRGDWWWFRKHTETDKDRPTWLSNRLHRRHHV